jgi:hypothetical protein
MQPVDLAEPEPETASPLRRFLRFAGVDQAIAYTVLARGWASVAGLVTIALIARSLSPAEQGYYYTFGSLVAMQLIFELGFSVVILQLATHEVAHLTLSPSGQITGPVVPHARLASVLRKSVRWYSVASLLMACALIPIGWHFFATNARPGTASVGWRLPWIAVVLASSVTFQIDPIFSFLEGCGFVARVARARLSQSMLGSLFAWCALLGHHGLFAPAFLISGQAVAGIYWISRRRRLLASLLRHPVGEHQIDWWQEVWPFQWRIAVSYACGFFIFQLFNPVLFHYWGPTAAGRMGMSLNISNALASVAIAWINTKAAPFGSLIARRDFGTLDTVFFRSMLQSTSISILGSAAVWTGSLLLAWRHLPFAQRILPPLPFALLLLSMNINQVVSSMAIYLRAHKQEKFLLNSVLGAVCIAVSTFFLGRAFGALGMAAGQFGVAVCVGLGLGTYTFAKWRRVWHA